MDIYLSPIYIILAGIFIVLICFKVHMPTALIAVGAGAAIGYTIYLHVSMFSTEYKTMSTGEWVQNLGPTLLTSAVVIMSIGYIIFFFKKDKALNAYKEYLPEESSSAKSWNPFGSKTPSTPAKSWNPFGSKTPSAPSQHQNDYSSPNLTKSERKEYISALDRLI